MATRYQIATVTGSQTFTNSNLSLPAAPSSNTAQGVLVTLTAGQNIGLGDVCRINSSGQAVRAQADNLGDAAAVVISTATISSGNPGVFLLYGIINNTNWSWTSGSILYLSNTAGSMTHSVVTGVGSVSQDSLV